MKQKNIGNSETFETLRRREKENEKINKAQKSLLSILKMQTIVRG